MLKIRDYRSGAVIVAAPAGGFSLCTSITAYVAQRQVKMITIPAAAAGGTKQQNTESGTAKERERT